MGITDLYNDYGIPVAQPGDRHYADGWVNTPCPLCTGNPGNHLGYNLGEHYYHCHRCGNHAADYVLVRLLGVSRDQAKQLIRDYRIKTNTASRPVDQSQRIKIKKLALKYPTGTGPLTYPHRKYLKHRGFDPDALESRYGIQGTGPTSRLERKDLTTGRKIQIDYRYRIIIPIFWDGQLVSFQARDYTGRQEPKYKACPQERELIHHQDIIYGWRNQPTDWAVVVEGVVDVWRLGWPAVATFGISYTAEQVRVLARMFKRVVTIYDPDPQAQQQVVKLGGELRFRGVQVENINLPTDPGDLNQQEANYLMKQFKK